MNLDRLTALWSWLESRPLAEHVGATWWFPFLESIHVLARTLLVGTIIMVDLRLLDWAARSYRASRVVRELIIWSWIAFTIAVAAGFPLFMTRASSYAANPAFQLKILLLLLAGINMAVFHRATARGIESWGAQGRPPRGARIAGAVSLLLWIGVVVAGRWTGHL